MDHPLLELHHHSMDGEPRVHFTCDEDWTNGVIERLKGFKSLELIFKPKLFLNAQFKQCHDIDRLKITLSQPGHYRLSWLLDRNANNSEASEPFFSKFLPEHLATTKCIESTSLSLTDLGDVTAILEKFLQDPYVYIDLMLGHCSLKGIPDIIFKQGNLRRLSIVGAPDLESISEDLGRLTLLHQLFISDTGLKHLPESLGNLKNLHRLEVGKNQLVNLPDSLAKLEQLKELDIHDNCFPSIPTVLEKAYDMRNVFNESDLKNMSESEIAQLVCVRTQLNERYYVRRN